MRAHHQHVATSNKLWGSSTTTKRKSTSLWQRGMPLQVIHDRWSWLSTTMYKRSPYRLFVHKWRAYPFYSYYIDHVVAGAAHLWCMPWITRRFVRVHCLSYQVYMNEQILFAGHRIFNLPREHWVVYRASDLQFRLTFRFIVRNKPNVIRVYWLASITTSMFNNRARYCF